jgi:putative membrane protein insertion efficiency factor
MNAFNINYLIRTFLPNSQFNLRLPNSMILKKLFILPIRIYQATLSPLLGSHCRHSPSCSQYTIEAIQEWGVLKGTWLGAKRIARCHPWGTSGYDPVPKKK